MVASTIATDLEITQVRRRKRANQCRCRALLLSLRWVRDHARDHCPKPEPSGRAVVVELDEMWHFVEKRRASSESGRPSSARPAG